MGRDDGLPAMFNRRSEFAEITAIIRDAINPIGVEIQVLKEKVDKLSQDRVTRTDIEKMRTEMLTMFIPRDSYEPRHAALIERDSQIESSVREIRRDLDDRVKSFEARFTQGSMAFQEYLQRLENKIDTFKKETEDKVDTKLKEQSETELSGKDRAWLRWNQVMFFVVGGIGLFDVILRIFHIQ